MRTYPFSLTEDQVNRLLELLEEELYIDEDMQEVLDALHMTKSTIMRERIEKLNYELDS